MTEEKLKDLLDSMSVEEKLGELWQPMNRVFDENGVLTGNDVKCNDTKEQIDGCGSTLNLFGIERLRKTQEEHIKNNPHHIPMLFMADIIHGFATLFPQPLAYSCSFDPELVEKLCRVTAKESAALGIHVTFYPMIDLVRDPRWGRVVESAGEDPYLASTMCEAIVRGLQGDGLDKPDTIAACVKHFAGYGGAEGGRDYNSVELSERSLRQYYLPGYKGGIDAGAKMVMTSYNTIGGVPSTINKHLMRDILRKEWGWDGIIITDLFALSSCSVHGIGGESQVGNDQLRYLAEAGIKTGVDIEMGSSHYRTLAESVKNGNIDISLIDEAVWRVLKLKNELGLFENPYRGLDQAYADQLLRCDEHLAVARRVSVDSCVLLKNENDILPLSKDSGRIAVIGPFTKMTGKNGAWVIFDDGANKSSLESTIQSRYGDWDITFAEGCSVLGREQANESKRSPDYADEEHREQMISEAVALASKSDTVVLTLGELQEMSGEATSRGNIRIPDIQLELFNRIYEVNQNIVVLLFNGRPLALTDIADRAKAILDVWYLGIMMDEAVTDLLFGEESPSGRLTMSFPTAVNQIPVYYNHLNTDHRTAPYWSEYIDDYSSEPLYPFGYGLTYSTLSYSDTTVDKTEFRRDETVTISATVTNTGKRDVKEVVQLYIRDPYAEVAQPVKELKGFKKLTIKAGESVKVDFTLTEEMLRYYHVDLSYSSDNGEFDVIVAPSSRFSRDKMIPIFMKD